MMGRIINDEYFSDAEIIVKLQAELAQLKSESGFGTLLAENRATIEQQAEQIAALKKRENYIDALSNTIVDRDATIQQQAEQIERLTTGWEKQADRQAAEIAELNKQTQINIRQRESIIAKDAKIKEQTEQIKEMQEYNCFVHDPDSGKRCLIAEENQRLKEFLEDIDIYEDYLAAQPQKGGSDE